MSGPPYPDFDTLSLHAGASAPFNMERALPVHAGIARNGEATAGIESMSNRLPGATFSMKVPEALAAALTDAASAFDMVNLVMAEQPDAALAALLDSPRSRS